MGQYGLYSNTQGPDGNGVFNPADPALGGHIGTANTPANSNTKVLMSGGFVPLDQMTTTVEALVQFKTPQTGQPTASGSLKLKGQFIRSGNTVTQEGEGVSSAAEIAVGLHSSSARLIVDSTKTPNEITVQVKPPGGTCPAIAWQWTSGIARSF